MGNGDGEAVGGAVGGRTGPHDNWGTGLLRNAVTDRGDRSWIRREPPNSLSPCAWRTPGRATKDLSPLLRAPGDEAG